MRAAGAFTLALCALIGSGCGYVGDPLPPALYIPERVTVLSAQQNGEDINIAFVLPALTADGLKIRDTAEVELRIGPSRPSFEAWLEESQRVAVATGAQVAPGEEVRVSQPAKPWEGQEIAVAVRTFGRTGRPSDWSELRTVPVVRPLAAPSAVTAEPTASGVQLAWRAVPGATSYRIARHEGEQKEAPAIDAPGTDVQQPPWTDNGVMPGTLYTYFVQARDGARVSPWSPEVPIKVQDTFPPPVPAGLTAVPALESIELSWEAAASPDVAGYHVYRSTSDGEWSRIAENVPVPAYSDRSIISGSSYRYVVTAVDRSSNESGRSEAVAVQAP